MKAVSNVLSTVNHFRESIPVDVEGLALALGIKVRKAYLSDNISGMIRKVKEGFEITVNARHPETRQRFTLAHEIGHYVLHRSLMGDGNVDDRAYRSDGSVQNNCIGPREETEANKFAANLLMPSEAIKKLRADGIDTPAKMAYLLKVSEGAMRIRLGLKQAD
jgi:Zn-dependent peptidase ImmA (M78 family)